MQVSRSSLPRWTKLHSWQKELLKWAIQHTAIIASFQVKTGWALFADVSQVSQSVISIRSNPPPWSPLFKVRKWRELSSACWIHSPLEVWYTWCWVGFPSADQTLGPEGSSKVRKGKEWKIVGLGIKYYTNYRHDLLYHGQSLTDFFHPKMWKQKTDLCQRLELYFEEWWGLEMAFLGMKSKFFRVLPEKGRG